MLRRHTSTRTPYPAGGLDGDDDTYTLPRKRGDGRIRLLAVLCLVRLRLFVRHATKRNVFIILGCLGSILPLRRLVLTLHRGGGDGDVDSVAASLALQNFLSVESGFHPSWHPERSDRFPTVTERVRLYMGNWYVPPCSVGGEDDQGRLGYRYLDDEAHIEGRIYRILKVDHAVSSNATGSDGLNQYRHHDTIDGRRGTIDLISRVHPDHAFYVHPTHHPELDDCLLPPFQVRREKRMYELLRFRWLFGRLFGEWEDRMTQRANMRTYCVDTVELLGMMERLDGEGDSEPSGPNADDRVKIIKPGNISSKKIPILIQYGDKPETIFGSHPAPLIMKFRQAATAEELRRVVITAAVNDTKGSGNNGDKPGYGRGGCIGANPTIERPRLRTVDGNPSSVYAPILWKLVTKRHFDRQAFVPYYDTPWEQKANVAVWRGALTGVDFDGIARAEAEAEVAAMGMGVTTLSPREKCVRFIPRCRLAFEAAGSRLVDAKVMNANTIDDIAVGLPSIFAEALTMEQMLRHKAVIIMQGNDVASGLKWALFSRSVVITPRPTITSWAMEEKLMPWVHFVPLDDVSQAEERMQWVLENDDAARKIAERATLFMWDLMFHEDAKEEERAVKVEILRRYRQHLFRRN